jgi:ectoine hydroxylase-related dioxygenase (phytanoyl-CoA dioxygenase family)
MTNDAIERAAAAIESDGYFIYADAISSALCDELVAGILRFETQGVEPQLRNPAHGYQTTRFHDLLNLGEIWQKLPVHQSILPVIRRVLGDDCLLNTYGSITINPGQTHQPVHVDDATFFGNMDASGQGDSALFDRPSLYDGGWRKPILINAMVALTDFTQENGATRIVPNSHTLSYPRHEDNQQWFEKSMPALMTKGSICFVEGQCIHGGGANTTNEVRRHAVAVSYCSGYLRTQENFLLSLAAPRMERFTSELQHLIGLRLSGSSGMGLGHVYNRRPEGMAKKVAISGDMEPPE